MKKKKKTKTKQAKIHMEATLRLSLAMAVESTEQGHMLVQELLDALRESAPKEVKTSLDMLSFDGVQQDVDEVSGNEAHSLLDAMQRSFGALGVESIVFGDDDGADAVQINIPPKYVTNVTKKSR